MLDFSENFLKKYHKTCALWYSIRPKNEVFTSSSAH